MTDIKIKTDVQLQRGSSRRNLAVTKSEGMLTYDRDLKSIRVHDGVVAGGFVLVRDAPQDGTIYGRHNGQWVIAKDQTPRNVWTINYDVERVPDTVGTGVTATIVGNDYDIHILNINANTTVQFDLTEGQGTTVHIKDGNQFLVTWVVDYWVGLDEPPTLTPYDIFEVWRVENKLFAGHAGRVA